MRTLLFVSLLVSVLALPVFAVDWVINPANGHSYTIVQSLDWWNAESQAVTLGGHLATINNVAENTWLYGEYSYLATDYYDVAIGMYQPNGENDSNAGWAWVSEEPFSYTNWDQGEPNGGTHENYGYFYLMPIKSGLWNDGQVFKIGRGIALVEVAPVPEPSSLVVFSVLLTPLFFRRRR